MARTTFPLLIIISLLTLVGCESRRPHDGLSDIDTAAKPGTARAAELFPPLDSTMQDSLRAIERACGGKLGVAAIHLESGLRGSWRGTESFPMASVAKLPMAIAFLRQVESGRYRLDSAVHITSGDHRPGASILFHRVMRDSGGVTMLHSLLESMIIYSDNTAADFLLRLAGGARPVDSLMTTLGLPHVDVSHSEGELILLWAGVDPKMDDSAWTRERVYAKIKEVGDTAWKQAEARLVDDPSDAATPEEMTRLLAMLQGRKLLGDRGTDTLMAIMSRTATGKARIPALLPEGTPVAHKTGTISSTTNDVGIITLPEGRGHLAITLFVKGSRIGVHARERAIARAAATMYRWAMAKGKI